MLLRILMIVALLFVLFAVYVRMAPVDPQVWHIDPEEAEDPGRSGYQLTAAQSPVWAEPPADVLAVLVGVALADGAVILAGTAEGGHVTLVSRTPVMGYPDYTGVKAVAGPDGTRLVILARQRFGLADLGVNRGRVEAWLQRLSAALPPQ